MVRALQRTALAAFAALALVGTAGSQEQPPLRGVVLERAMPSKALRGKLSFEVYLPPGYVRSTARFRGPPGGGWRGGSAFSGGERAAGTPPVACGTSWLSGLTPRVPTAS